MALGVGQRAQVKVERRVSRVGTRWIYTGPTREFTVYMKLNVPKLKNFRQLSKKKIDIRLKFYKILFKPHLCMYWHRQLIVKPAREELDDARRHALLGLGQRVRRGRV